MTTFMLDPVNGIDVPYDVKGKTATLQATADVAIDTARYGMGVLNLRPGTSAARLEIPDSTDWAFPDQFTAEAEATLAGFTAGSSFIFGQNAQTGPSGSWGLYINAAGTALIFGYANAAATSWLTITGNYAFNLNETYHIAVDRDATSTIRLYVNGSVLTSLVVSQAITDTTGNFIVGNNGGLTGKFNGTLEEVRITKGLARYAGAFTRPSAEHPTGASDPNWANVVLLVRAPSGQTFKGRWKTLTFGTTAARVAPGDVIRYIASPDPVSLGNVAWTDGSRTLTLPAARTLTVDNFVDAWTGTSANVTLLSTTTPRKLGTTTFGCTIATAFTTGKIAYKTLSSPVDLSLYQQLCVWFRNTSTSLLDGAIELRLCSDTTGDVPVYTLPLCDGGTVPADFRVAIKDFKSYLTTPINSFSLWANSDPGSTSMYLSHLIACLPSSDPNAITLLSLIGKNTTAEPEWYPIRTIEGTVVTLGNAVTENINSAATTSRNYSGVTETVTTYRLQPLDSISGQGTSGAVLAANRNFPDNGTDGSPITISGGWNRTDMATQTGVTWLTGGHMAGYGIDVSSRSYIDIEKVGFAHFTSGPIQVNNSTNGVNIKLEGVVGCVKGWDNSIGYGCEVDLKYVVSCAQGIVISPTGNGVLRARRVTGTMSDALYLYGASAAINRYYLDKVDNNNGYGITYASTSTAKSIFYNFMGANNVNADIDLFNLGEVLFINPLLNSTSKLQRAGGQAFASRVSFQNFDRNLADHRTYTGTYTLTTDSTVRFTASGISWKFSPYGASNVNLVTSRQPARFSLMKRRVKAGVTSTWKVQVRRDNLLLTAGIRVAGGQVAGVVSDVTDTHSAAINTWQQLTVSFTPTEDSTVELEGWAYGGTDQYNAWFDSITIS